MKEKERDTEMEKEKGCRYKTTALIIYSDI